MKRILVIRLSALGDVILSFGAAAAIRRKYPEAEITFLTTKPFSGLLEKSPWCDRVWTVARKPLWHILTWRTFLKKIEDENFDAVYDLQQNRRTRLLRHFASAHLKKNWFGRDNPRDGDLDVSDSRNFPVPDMSWMDSDTAKFGLPSQFVLLVPGCSPRHPQKRWPASRYAALATALAEKGFTPIALGTAAEAEVIDDLCARAPAVISLAGKTSFMDIAALARKAAGAVGNDTGPMHLIAAAGCPCVSLFSGASDPAQSAPHGRKVSVLRGIPIENIDVQSVLDAFLGL